MWLLAAPLAATALTGALLSGCTDRWAGPKVQDATGATHDVRERDAPGACGWEHVRILSVPAVVIATITKGGPATGLIRFAADPVREATEYLAVPYSVDDTIPPGISKTPYHKGGRELWVRPDDAGRAVVVLDPKDNTVERWPRINAPCLDE